MVKMKKWMLLLSGVEGFRLSNECTYKCMRLYSITEFRWKIFSIELLLLLKNTFQDCLNKLNAHLPKRNLIASYMKDNPLSIKMNAQVFLYCFVFDVLTVDASENII